MHISKKDCFRKETALQRMQGDTGIFWLLNLKIMLKPDEWGMYTLELTDRQLVMVLTFIHSSMNQELVEEYVEDENWDAGYEDELSQLQEKYPHDLIEPLEQIIGK